MVKDRWTPKQTLFVFLGILFFLMGLAGAVLGVFNVGSGLLCGFGLFYRRLLLSKENGNGGKEC